MKFIKNKFLYLILLLGLALRLISLNQSLWLDEAIGAIAVHDYSYLGIITNFIKGDTHPPLYYLTLKLWTDIFGYSEVAMRMLSVIFGVATVYVVYLIANVILNQESRIKNQAGKLSSFPIIAALLFATAPLHIYYSQEVRMYAMNTLLVSLVILYYLKKDWWKYSITLLILGMTDYLPLLILPVLWFYEFYCHSGENVLNDRISTSTGILSLRSRMTFLFAHLPLAIFLLLWFPTFVIQSAGSKDALQLFPGWGQLIGKAGIKELSLVWVKFLIGRITFDNKLLYMGLVLLSSIVVALPFIKSLQHFNKTKLLWLWLVIPVALTFIGAIFVPGFSYFRMIIVLPAFYMLIAYGIVKVGELTVMPGLTRYLPFLRTHEGGGSTSRALQSRIVVRDDVLGIVIVILNVSFSLLYLLNPTFHREDWRGSVSYISQNAKDGDIVLQAFPEPFAGYRWYAKQFISIPAYGATQKLGATNDEIKSNTQNVIRDTTGIYYFEYLHDQTDPQNIIPTTLSENGFTIETAKDVRGVGIVEYWRRGGS
jgi:hypothetical protein